MRSNLQQQENGDLEENEEIEYEAHENEGEEGRRINRGGNLIVIGHRKVAVIVKLEKVVLS